MDMAKMSQAEKMVGGRFLLTTLLQKRCVEIMRGARPMVFMGEGPHRPIEIALEEVVQEKIVLGPPDPETATEDEGAGHGSDGKAPSVATAD
ncbi:MAG: DNA-directed RNA polymerase subunit omega [Planctomycetes bacterium]|nr:DNA-directed RNA polymerase subunit omega [Planctomycetota bacterium]